MGTRRYDDPAAFRQALEERLRRTAEERGLAVNALRLKLLIERLLARLFAEPSAPWLLKGGYAMELRFRPRARTTRDLDLACAAAAPDRPEAFRLDAVRERLQEDAARALGDHFVYRIGQAARLVEAAPGGGARFPVVVLLAGREYGRFHVDVGLGPPPPGVSERLAGDDLLAFAGLAPAVALAVPRETQFAEKIHAFTRPWDDRVNTRTKDLVDLLLLVQAGLPDRRSLAAALRQAFAGPPGHALPAELPQPPAAWRADFAVMATQAGLDTSELDDGFRVLAVFWRENRLGRPD